MSAALLVFLVVRLVTDWREHPLDLAHARPLALAAGVLLCVLSTVWSGFIWIAILRRLGCRAPWSWVGIFFRGQLGKYLPGSVWQYAGRVALLRLRQVPVRTATTSLGIELAGSVAAAALMSALLLGPWGFAVWAAGLLAWLVARRPRAAGSIGDRLRCGADASVLYLGMWLAFGFGFAFLARALFEVPASDLPYYSGAFALAWLAGVAAVFAPGGVGIREAVIVALLRGRLGGGDAVALAFASRLVLFGIDLLAGAAAVMLARPARGPGGRRRASLPPVARDA